MARAGSLSNVSIISGTPGPPCPGPALPRCIPRGGRAPSRRTLRSPRPATLTTGHCRSRYVVVGHNAAEGRKGTRLARPRRRPACHPERLAFRGEEPARATSSSWRRTDCKAGGIRSSRFAILSKSSTLARGTRSSTWWTWAIGLFPRGSGLGRICGPSRFPWKSRRFARKSPLQFEQGNRSASQSHARARGRVPAHGLALSRAHGKSSYPSSSPIQQPCNAWASRLAESPDGAVPPSRLHGSQRQRAPPTRRQCGRLSQPRMCSPASTTGPAWSSRWPAGPGIPSTPPSVISPPA